MSLQEMALKQWTEMLQNLTTTHYHYVVMLRNYLSVKFSYSKTYWHSDKLRVIDTKTRTCSRINCTIAKLSTTDGRLVAYIGVQLSNEAGKVVVLEIFGQEISGKLWWAPYYESATILSPRDHGICGRVIHQVVGFCEEGSRHWSMTIVEKQATGLWVVERQWHTVNDVFSHLQNNLWSSIKL